MEYDSCWCGVLFLRLVCYFYCLLLCLIVNGFMYMLLFGVKVIVWVLFGVDLDCFYL